MNDIYDEISIEKTTLDLAGSCNGCSRFVIKNCKERRPYTTVHEITINRLTFRLCSECLTRLHNGLHAIINGRSKVSTGSDERRKVPE